MQGLAVLFVLGWLISTPWAMVLVVGVILAGIALVTWVWMKQILDNQPATSTWNRVEPRFEPSSSQEPISERQALKRRIEQLERDLKASRSEVSALRSRAEQLERDLQTAGTAQPGERTDPLFRRVGLDQHAPEWVASAVRRAYRKRLHPDAHPEGRKAEAERRFKEAEKVFDEIWRVRGFGS